MKAFSLAVIFLLFFELFAPMAYAAGGPTATPTPSATPSTSISPTPLPTATGSQNPDASGVTSTSPTPIPSTGSATGSASSSYSVGGCFINAMSDSDRNQLRDFLFRQGKPFQADWLNDYSATEAALNPGAPGDPLKRRELSPEEEFTIPLKDLADMAGIDGNTVNEKEEKVAKALDIWDYQNNKVKDKYVVNGVPMATAKDALSYLERNPGNNAKAKEAMQLIQDQIKSLTNSKEKEKKEKEAAADLRPYERYKITIPETGKPMALADFLAQKKINPNSCLLKNAVINGKVSYAAILDADLTFSTGGKKVFSGDVVSPATNQKVPELVSSRTFSGEKIPENLREDSKGAAASSVRNEENKATINQFLTGDKVVGYLDLNGGGNIIVPEFFRDWTVFVNSYTKWDLYISAGVAIATLGAGKTLADAKKILEDRSQRLTRLRDNPLSNQDVSEELFGKPIQQNGRFLMENPTTVNGQRSTHFDIDPSGNIRYYSGSTGSQVHTEPLIMTQGQDPLTSAVNQKKATIKREPGIEDKIHEADENLNRYKNIKHTLTSRVTASYMIAGGWLGSARLLYSHNQGLLFQIRQKGSDQFYRLLVNKPVLDDFRRASGILALGRIQETLARYLGEGLTPEKAFFTKRQVLLNKPQISKTPAEKSLTGFNEVGGDLAIFTMWTGYSYSVNYEDVRGLSGENEFTSVDLVSYRAFPDPVLVQKDMKTLTTLAALAVPFLAARRILDLQESALGAAIFLTTLQYLQIPGDFGKGQECRPEPIEELKNKFRLAFYGSVATTLVSSALPFTTATSFWKTLGIGAARVLDWTNPGDIYKWYITSEAAAYTSNCKDPMHTILSYQKVPDRVAPKSSNPLTSGPLADQLNIGRLFNPPDDEKKLSEEVEKKTEILNIRSTLTNQVGFFYTPELLFFHIKDSTHMTKTGVYDLIKGSCDGDLRLQSSDGRSVTLTKDGLNLYGQNGELLASFRSAEWKIRAVTQTINQWLARAIIPNKIITSRLTGGDSSFLQISSLGRATLINGPCDFRAALKELTGRDIGSDLSSALGSVKAITTDQGNVGIVDGKVYFVNPSGKAAVAPTPEDLVKAVGEGSRVSVKSNGKVIIHGGEVRDRDAGIFKDILFENGMIVHDASSGRIDLILYSLFETSSQNLAGITLGKSATGQGLTVKATAKVGQEATAEKLNTALNKIAGKEGITMLETKERIIQITPDGKLRIIDKVTGKAQEYDLTGPIRQEGNQIVIPTGQGDLKLTLNNDNGRPTLASEGLGLKEVAALLAARGQQGILTFNPSTGAINVYNGQDIPMNPSFAEKGIGVAANSDGTTFGVPLENPFEKRDSSGIGITQPSPLFLPSWPTELFPLFLAILALLGGVTYIRFQKNE